MFYIQFFVIEARNWSTCDEHTKNFFSRIIIQRKEPLFFCVFCICFLLTCTFSVCFGGWLPIISQTVSGFLHQDRLLYNLPKQLGSAKLNNFFWSMAFIWLIYDLKEISFSGILLDPFYMIDREYNIAIYLKGRNFGWI